jgi:hypothetical protein
MQSRRWYIFLLVAGLLFTNYWLLVANSYAQQESVTITTYYPSPYGSYNQLEVYRSVRYKPFNNMTEINNLTDPQAGELVYNGSDNKFYYYDGSAWVPQAGGGGPGSWTCRAVSGVATCKCTPPEKLIIAVCQYPIAGPGSGEPGIPWDYGAGVFGIECSRAGQNGKWGLCCQ